MKVMRSSSEPHPTIRRHRRRLSETPSSPLVSLSGVPCMLRRGRSCSATPPASSPPTAASPEASTTTSATPQGFPAPGATLRAFRDGAVRMGMLHLPAAPLLPPPAPSRPSSPPPPLFRQPSEGSGFVGVVSIAEPAPAPAPVPATATVTAAATALAPAPPQTPDETADEATQPAAAAAPVERKVRGTGPGKCVVCLEDCDDVFGHEWLHPPRCIAAAAATGASGGMKRGDNENGNDDGRDGKEECDGIPAAAAAAADRDRSADATTTDACSVSACAECLETYFTGIVEKGFNGACPRMRCMSCPRIVCESAWAPLVDPSVLETFQRRAATLLSIQCGMCHSRGTIMAIPPSDHSYSSAVDALMARVDTTLGIAATADDGHSQRWVNEEGNDGNVAPALTVATGAAAAGFAVAAAAADGTGIAAAGDIDNGYGSGNDDKAIRASSASFSSCSSATSVAGESVAAAKRLKESFRAELDRYASGEEVDVSPCYLALEGVFQKPRVREMDDAARSGLLLLLLNCIEDSERRASLHIRFIRSNPTVLTLCCNALHCFRCRVVNGHAPLTCDEYEARRGHEEICKCPGCGVFIVKGDGCDAIACICGHAFSWSSLVEDRRVQVANAFRDAHPEDTGRAAAQILRRGPPAPPPPPTPPAPTPAGVTTPAAVDGQVLDWWGNPFVFTARGPAPAGVTTPAAVDGQVLDGWGDPVVYTGGGPAPAAAAVTAAAAGVTTSAAVDGQVLDGWGDPVICTGGNIGHSETESDLGVPVGSLRSGGGCRGGGEGRGAVADPDGWSGCGDSVVYPEEGDGWGNSDSCQRGGVAHDRLGVSGGDWGDYFTNPQCGGGWDWDEEANSCGGGSPEEWGSAPPGGDRDGDEGALSTETASAAGAAPDRNGPPPMPAPQQQQQQQLSEEEEIAEEFRLASAYAALYQREVGRARAAIYGEENPHFTVQKARFQSGHPATWLGLGPVAASFSGRPSPPASSLSDAEIEWQATAATNWLSENRAAVITVERAEAAARSSLVEALFGGDDGDTPGGRLQQNMAIAHTAAEHARAALRVAEPLGSPTATAAAAAAGTGGAFLRRRSQQEQRRQRQLQHQGRPRRRSEQDRKEEDEGELEPLFRWLGIAEPLPPRPSPAPPGAADALADDEDGGNGNNEEEEEGEEQWFAPFAEAEIEWQQQAWEAIPAPLELWTPYPNGRLAPRETPARQRAAPGPDPPAGRLISALAEFGSLRIGGEVERWVAGSGARQEQLRALMAVEERELAKAWVALWARRRRLDRSSKTWIDAGGGPDDAGSVRAAARRVVFLEAYPEQACQEQAAMMKAFVRRNRAAVAVARRESDAALAAAWERIHCDVSGTDPGSAAAAAAETPTVVALGATASAKAAATVAVPSLPAFDIGYGGYLRYVEATASGNALALARRLSTFSPAAGSPATTAAPDLLRRIVRMADAWESINCPRIRARRFADRFAPAAPAAAATAAAANPDPLFAKGEAFVISGCSEAENAVSGVDLTAASTSPGAAAADDAAATDDSVATAGTATAATAAVVAVVVAPMLLGRAPRMCDCGLASVLGDAVDWVSYNSEAFEEELDRLNYKMSAPSSSSSSVSEPPPPPPQHRGGGAATFALFGGCECGGGGQVGSSSSSRSSCSSSSSCCGLYAACPVVVRRILKAAEPVCGDCEVEDGLFAGDLFDFFS